jgi:hypothetical protein
VDDEAIIDVRSTANFVGYVQRSTGRRRRIMVTTFVTTLGLVAALCVVMPRVFKITTSILTH